MPLSEKSTAILKLLARGYGYDQVLLANENWTLHDIFAAAAEALELADGSRESKFPAHRTIAKLREVHPQAYAPWSYGDDWQLRTLLASGGTIPEIAAKMGRSRAAISRRMESLGYMTGRGRS